MTSGVYETPEVVYDDHGITVHGGDCVEVLRSLPDASIDSIVTDPPYGLEFMGKDWDSFNGANYASITPGNDSPHARRNSVNFTGSPNPTCRTCGGLRSLNTEGSGGRKKCRCETGDFPNYRLKAMRAFQAWCKAWATEAYRVLKPGGHMLAFGGTRTWHRLGCAVEDAGFEIRDSIAWMHSQGFPKNLDVAKAIDKAQRRDYVIAAVKLGLEVPGNNLHDWTKAEHSPGDAWWERFKAHLSPEDWQRLERAVVGVGTSGATAGMQALGPSGIRGGEYDITTPATPDAERWSGWGTAMKPSHEPVLCARKPLNAVPFDWRLVTDVHHALAGLLWLSLSPAKRAVPSSPSSQAGQLGATCVSALVAAATDTSRDGYVETATYNSPATAATSLSIASSWGSILAELSAPMSMFTTSTRSSTTTALRTLSSLLGPVTLPTTMPPCECLIHGPSSSAGSAESSSSDAWASWLHTLSASVPESAIEGIALAVASALAHVAESPSVDLGAGSSADVRATAGADANSSPAFEPIVVARKPLVGNVASNVLEFGTGALNIDGCRVGVAATDDIFAKNPHTEGGFGHGAASIYGTSEGAPVYDPAAGRWPANVVLDSSMGAALDQQSGELHSQDPRTRYRPSDPAWSPSGTPRGDHGVRTQSTGADAGGASRFYVRADYEQWELELAARFRYTAKAPGAERVVLDDEGHPTVKPLALIRWLTRLITPPGGTCLDLFGGSGPTAEACILEGFDCVIIERSRKYVPYIMQRINRRLDPVAAVAATRKADTGDVDLFTLLDGGDG